MFRRKSRRPSRLDSLRTSSYASAVPNESALPLVAVLCAVSWSAGMLAGCERNGSGSASPGAAGAEVDPYTCTGAPLEPLAMGEAMQGEEHGEVFDTKVIYLDEAGRKAHALSVTDGRVLGPDGAPFDTGGALAIFVLSPEGQLYGSAAQEKGKFHHSSFLAGAPVGGAGEFIVADGTIEVLSDHSGHYRPRREDTGQALCWFAEHGVNLSEVSFHPFSGGELPASSLIERGPAQD